MWTTSGAKARSSRRSRDTPVGCRATFETAPLNVQPIVPPSGTSHSGAGSSCGRAPRCSSAVRRVSWSYGANTRTSCPRESSCSASACTCRLTPPGYVHEYGETSPSRILKQCYPASTMGFMARERHFVKYTFLKVDPAWRRLDADERAEHKREFIAACEDFASQRLLRAFSTVGTRGDTDMMLLTQATNLDRIHEFHVVLAQSGLMKW